MTIEMRDLPTFKRYGGGDCVVCGERHRVCIRYDVRASDGVREWSYVASECKCGFFLGYRNGDFSWIPPEKYDSRKALLDDIRQSGFEYKESGFKKHPLPSL